MNCDPQSLMDAARCLNCIPMGMMASVATKLLCDLANSEEGPAEVPFSYTPETNLIDWTDATGPHTGDLANFRATADIPTVIGLQFPSLLIPSPFNITAIEGLATLPALNTLFLAANLVETLDCSGCVNLTNINANGNQLGTAGGNINVTGCVNLQQLTCDFNANLTTIVGLPDCVNLGTLTCTNCAITALDVHACAALVVFQSDFNNLTVLDCDGLLNLGLLTCSNNNLMTDLTANGCTALLTVDCNTNGLLTTLDVTNCTNLANLNGSFCTSLAGITGIATCTSINNLLFANAGITSLTLGVVVNMNSIDLTFCPITSFVAASLQTVAADIFLDATSLNTLTLTNLVSVGNQFAAQASTMGPTLNLPALVSVGAPVMDLANMTSLVTLSAPNLATTTNNITASNSTSLTTLVLNSYLPSNGFDIGFFNCSLNSGSIDMILSRCVASAGWGFAVETLDLSGGTNLSHASWSGAALADEATLVGRGAIILSNP